MHPDIRTHTKLAFLLEGGGLKKGIPLANYCERLSKIVLGWVTVSGQYR